MIFEQILNPTEIIEIGEIKIHLKGVDFRTEQYIEAPKLRGIKTIEELEYIGAEIASRVIRHVVKKIEGIQLKIDDNIVDFELQFDSNGAMSLESYTVFMRILNQIPEVITKIQEFYSKSIELKKVDIKKK